MEKFFAVADDLKNVAEKAEKLIAGYYQEIDKIAAFNQAKVLKAFQQERVSDFHFNASTGYAYNDLGRETLEKVYAAVFGSEKALVRLQISSGTHAISLCLYGILRPGDTVLSISGSPYDTLEEVLGSRNQGYGSLKDFNINYKKIDLLPDGKIDFAKVKAALTPETKMVMLQRSRGYSWRPSFTIAEIKEAVDFVKNLRSDIVFFVDNCYGEFVETREPTEVGADLMAGSLIKNPGGGIAPTGGYVAGKEIYVDKAAARLTAPGIGGEIGATLGYTRLLFQGFYLAPHIVSEALKGAVFAAQMFQELGFEVSPKPGEKRTDIIQAIKMNEADKLIAFCQGLQHYSPIDSHVSPEPAPQPGYQDKIIMAAGAFVEGASIELSADGPLRPPYIAYLQGGLVKEQIKIAVIGAIQMMLEKRILSLELK